MLSNSNNSKTVKRTLNLSSVFISIHFSAVLDQIHLLGIARTFSSKALAGAVR